MTSPSRKVVRVSTLTFVLALKRLQAGACTAAEIEEATGLHRHTVYRLLTAMCLQDVAHEQDDRAPDSRGRKAVRVYALGAAPKQKPFASLGN